MSWWQKSSRNSRQYGGFPKYVSVAERQASAAIQIKKLEKSGKKLCPITIPGRLIARSAWGRGWCEHLEKFHDYFNRLERGRSYARNGSIIHLEINPGQVSAMVSGSSIYNVSISIEAISKPRWQGIVKQCFGAVASWLDLLAGRFSEGVMAVLADPVHGLFPQRQDVKMKCSCPDGAMMCKHVAAVLYGVGARLDTEPEMLFKLRQVDATELLDVTMQSDALTGVSDQPGKAILEGEDSVFAELFGIEIDTKLTKSVKAKRLPKAVDATKTADTAEAPVAPVVRPTAAKRGRPPKKVAETKFKEVLPVVRKRGRPAAGSEKKELPVVTAVKMLEMGFSRADIARFLKNGSLKKHARGQYQTTMPLAKYHDI